MNYTKSSHVTYDARFHIVWITKYRKKCLSDTIQDTVQKTLEGVCKELYVKILALGMEDDHVHMYVRMPHTLLVPKLVQRLKGRSSHNVWKNKNHRNYLRYYYQSSGGKSLWATGYFFATVGAVDAEIIKHYVELQGREETEGIEITL